MCSTVPSFRNIDEIYESNGYPELEAKINTFFDEI